jgi:hypothetical protein
MSYLKQEKIDEFLRRSECVMPDETCVISLRKLRKYMMKSTMVIHEDELMDFLWKHRTYSVKEIVDICNKVYRPTLKDKCSICVVRLTQKVI